MASQDAFNPLRVATQCLSSTPSKQLPHVAHYLATAIAQSGETFAAPTMEGQAVGRSDFAVIVHKLKTQLSALLQDKSPEARYAAVVLIKPTVEVGGWNILQGAGLWVRGLVSILGKLDSLSTKKLCIITLTRIFLLTHEHQSLVREITTPSLPGFITACLNLAKIARSSKAAQESYIQSPLLFVILQALSELIAMHPTSFRPFVPQIQSVAYQLIAPTPSYFETGTDPISSSASVSQSARRLFVLLHVSGPKNTAGEEWAKSLDVLMISVQRTVDKVFRSLIEDSSTEKYDVLSSNLAGDVVSDQKPAPMALPAWVGIHAGIERLDGLLHTLQAFLVSATAVAIILPIGSILNLVDRVLSAFPPGNGRNPRVRPVIGRDEREGLWVGLPRLQRSAIGVCSLLISRVGHSSAGIVSTILEQLLWTFESQHRNDDFREAAYGLLSQILTAFGPSLPRTYSISLSRCIRICCEDLLPSVESQLQGGQASFPDNQKSPNGIRSSANADSYLKPANNQGEISSASTNVLQAARELLPLTLMNLPDDYLPFSLRCQIDRTAIITKNQKAMLASVMNPIFKRKGQKQASSILPLLARAYPEALEVEALLRPQMPPIQSRRSDEGHAESVEEEDTYMHDQPQIGESDRFYHDLVGTNGNANVSGVQVDAIPGAVEEATLSTEPTGRSEITATGLREIKPALSYPSTKHDREEDSDFDKREFDEGDSKNQAKSELAGKRLRVGNGEIGTEIVMDSAPAYRAIVNTGGPGQAVKKVSALDSAAVSDRHRVLQQEDSDESEFEMPILNLDPDTDEEAKEDGEEDEEED